MQTQQGDERESQREQREELRELYQEPVPARERREGLRIIARRSGRWQ